MNLDKTAGVIHKCRRCGRLRDVHNEPEGCPHCLLNGIVSHFVEALVLVETEHDILPDPTVEAIVRHMTDPHDA